VASFAAHDPRMGTGKTTEPDQDLQTAAFYPGRVRAFPSITLRRSAVMSNIFIKGTAPFYSVPQVMVNSGLLKDLSAGATKLYQLLLFTAQARSKSRLELSNLEIRQRAGLSPNTIRRARTKLMEVRLIDLEQVLGERYTYVILNPLTGLPLPNRRSFPRPGGTPLPNRRSFPRPGGTPPGLSQPPTPGAPSIAPQWSQIGK
jgi:hypothetical protein